MPIAPRDRVLMALNHEEPDRVPLFIGTSGVVSILGSGYARLRRHFGLAGTEPRWFSRQFGYSWIDEDVLQRLGCDGRPVLPGPPPSMLRRDDSADSLVDEWGCLWRKKAGCEYFEVERNPLGDATVDDLDRFAWPDLAAPSRFAGLAERCREIQQAGYACVLSSGIILFERAYMMRGLEECLVDLAANEEFYLALQDRLKRLAIPYLEELLGHVGPYVDVITTGDDLGTQDSTLMSPATYRRLIKPHEAEILATIRKHTKAKVFFHTCGNVYPLIGDLIDIGVDILHPVQVSTRELGDTARLKREFGSRISFCGAIDTRTVLPSGTTDDVRREVRRRIADLAPGGGYIAAAVHCIQPDVPPANIVAMCDAVQEFGRYPIG